MLHTLDLKVNFIFLLYVIRVRPCRLRLAVTSADVQGRTKLLFLFFGWAPSSHDPNRRAVWGKSYTISHPEVEEGHAMKQTNKHKLFLTFLLLLFPLSGRRKKTFPCFFL